MIESVTHEPDPAILYYDTSILPPKRRWRITVVPLLCLSMAWMVGILTNAVSGTVSRVYFDTIVGWMYGGRMSLGQVVLQGLLESSIFGGLFAIVFTAIYSVITQARCPLRIVIRQLLETMIVVLILWLVGGLLGIAWAGKRPADFRAVFSTAPSTLSTEQLICWAFVGGSIWGVYAGGVTGIVLSSIGLHLRWKRAIRTGVLSQWLPEHH